MGGARRDARVAVGGATVGRAQGPAPSPPFLSVARFLQAIHRPRMKKLFALVDKSRRPHNGYGTPS